MSVSLATTQSPMAAPISTEPVVPNTTDQPFFATSGIVVATNLATKNVLYVDTTQSATKPAGFTATPSVATANGSPADTWGYSKATDGKVYANKLTGSWPVAASTATYYVCVTKDDAEAASTGLASVLWGWMPESIRSIMNIKVFGVRLGYIIVVLLILAVLWLINHYWIHWKIPLLPASMQ